MRLCAGTLQKYAFIMLIVAFRRVFASICALPNGPLEIRHLRENLSYLDGSPLPDEVVKALDVAWAVLKAETANC
jgi:hypothetical protein